MFTSNVTELCLEAISEIWRIAKIIYNIKAQSTLEGCILIPLLVKYRSLIRYKDSMVNGLVKNYTSGL